MTQDDSRSQFSAPVLRPRHSAGDASWAFVVLPREASAKLPRRGRVSIDGSINGQAFRALLEPDGRNSHWLKIEQALLEAAGASVGELARFDIMSVANEPEPEVPADMLQALASHPEALATWDDTTTLARLDWIHWVTSAKQAGTRTKRIGDACDMLAAGKKRVCCFDPSGFYSKAFSAPDAED
ncbi:YdeI/OmpD-associated family protein [Pseudomonas sp. CAU 1711]|uniref:YdeI/OmpD-associated family protein n=1 Tax=Pseudomonas sp. CAU 1711 TaxID=3140356 RepID=UPI003261CC46